MDLQELRKEIDRIDHELIGLFGQRMDVAGEIAAYKKEHNIPTLDARREREKLHKIAEMTPEQFKEYAVSLYSLLFELSRSHQNRLLGKNTDLTEQITRAIADTQPLFPKDAFVACQGVEGSYSQLACDRLFKMPSILYFSNFDAVFSAVEKGLCRYGVIPLENSTAGSVNAVYDLMQKHNFRIVRSVRVKVDHNLLAKPGVKKEDIREVFSHEQAISQCAGYLEKLGADVKITRCENTALAAEAVAKSGRGDVAAIASHSCVELYGLKCIESDIQDRSNNYTRFICISKDLEVYPGANHTSVMMTLPHRPGSLCRALSRFSSLGINITKLESRPIPERDFQFMFHFDLETSVYSNEFGRMIDDLDSISEEFRYLGSYSEVM